VILQKSFSYAYLLLKKTFMVIINAENSLNLNIICYPADLFFLVKGTWNVKILNVNLRDNWNILVD